MACKCDEAGDYGKCPAHGDNSDFAKRVEIPHTVSLTRAELQAEWDASSRIVERLTEAVKTLAEERDDARKERDAYKKAKQENDERFMLERDEARKQWDELAAEVKFLRGAVSVAGHHCEIRKCQACGHAYSKGWTRPCGHDEDSPVEK